MCANDLYIFFFWSDANFFSIIFHFFFFFFFHKIIEVIFFWFFFPCFFWLNYNCNNNSNNNNNNNNKNRCVLLLLLLLIVFVIVTVFHVTLRVMIWEDVIDLFREDVGTDLQKNVWSRCNLVWWHIRQTLVLTKLYLSIYASFESMNHITSNKKLRMFNMQKTINESMNEW